MKRILLLNLLLIAFLTSSLPLAANWHRVKSKDGAVELVYDPNIAGKPLSEVLAALKESGDLLRIDSCRPNIIKNHDLNRQVVEALAQVSGKNPDDLGDSISWSSFHHPEIRHFWNHLANAIVTLPPFAELEKELLTIGLTVEWARCEKFSFKKEDGQRLISGIGMYLSIRPVDFGLPEVQNKIPGRLRLSQLLKEKDQWIALFSLSSEDGLQKIYGRWSEKDQCYLITQHDLGSTDGKAWQTALSEPIPQDSPSFKIKEGLTYQVRVPLGSRSSPRAKIRIYSPDGVLDSEEFILSEASYSFRENE